MLIELEKQYHNGDIQSDCYDEKLFEQYETLFDFSIWLKGNACKKIEITDKGVLCIFYCFGREIKMYLDKDDYCAVPAQILGYGNYEPEETSMVLKIAKYLDKKSVFFDIGANLGWYSLNLHAKFPDMQCFMFEPVPETYKRLCDNVMVNGIDKGFCHNIGLYNKQAKLDFYYDVKASGASSLCDLRGKETTIKMQCMMKKLDDFVENQCVNRLDLIKCDVEGSELFVYQGGIKSIIKYKPVIYSEMLRKWAAKFNYHPNDIIKLLSDIGYECFVISGQDKKLKHFLQVNEETIETNYFFLCKEKHNEIIHQLCI